MAQTALSDSAAVSSEDSVVTVIQVISLKDRKNISTHVLPGDRHTDVLANQQDTLSRSAVSGILPVLVPTEDPIYGISEFSGPEAITKSILDERVIVGKDTVPIVMKERNFSRFDRGLFNFLFIPKGQWHFSLTASYGELNTDDVSILSIIKDLDLGGKIYSIKPSVGYFFKSNHEIGVQFNYTKGFAHLGNIKVKFDDDLKFDLHDVKYDSSSFGFDIFYRTYIGLSAAKRFGFYNEIDFSYSSSSSVFERYYTEVLRRTQTSTSHFGLNFSPGICIFLMDYVSFHVSFGVFGLYIDKEKQITDGVEEGSRTSSGANFKFNLFNINFGIGIHI